VTIKRFEDLEVWTIEREMPQNIYDLTRNSAFARDYGMIDQIRRAAVSVMSNISEGFERGSNKDFARFLFMARGSAGEVRSLLYVSLDQGYIDRGEFESCYKLCIRCSQTIWGLIRHVSSKSDWKTGGRASGNR